ncbi:MAG: hypothetical protein PHV40_04895 [Candidatus Omnitrophica bacterium]|nr:hypothetical protein [Candidatus Omnitrophota bacterium]
MKKIVFAGAAILCISLFSLSRAQEAGLSPEGGISIEFKIVCPGAGQSDCAKFAAQGIYKALYVKNEAFLSLDDIVAAKVIDAEDASSAQGSALELRLNKDGTQKFNEITSKNAGRSMAVFVDGELLATIRIYDPVITGKISIKNLDKAKAQDLAGRINKSVPADNSYFFF